MRRRAAASCAPTPTLSTGHDDAHEWRLEAHLFELNRHSGFPMTPVNAPSREILMKIRPPVAA
jgi:hypothetical protein